MPIDTEPSSEEVWRRMLTEGEPVVRRMYRMLALLPASPRCKLCAAPFRGWGGQLMRWTGREQSEYNPRFCKRCEIFEEAGGAEVSLTMFFADVRGSTRLAEQMSASEFGRLMSRFYSVASDVLVQSDAMVDRLLGDEVVGLYIPGFAGPDHARRAIEAAKSLLHATGHGHHGREPWLPVGIGVHTGHAFVGVIGGEQGGPKDFTALGDNVNITARLASLAGAGEALISEAALAEAGVDAAGLEERQLTLKGRSEPVGVRVLTVER